MQRRNNDGYLYQVGRQYKLHRGADRRDLGLEWERLWADARHRCLRVWSAIDGWPFVTFLHGRRRHADHTRMTYLEAVERLRGHHGWWFYDYHGSEREPNEATRQRVQAEAIELAQTWVRPLPDIDGHLREAASLPEQVKPCGACP
jgi:hypothetical protein